MLPMSSVYNDPSFYLNNPFVLPAIDITIRQDYGTMGSLLPSLLSTFQCLIIKDTQNGIIVKRKLFVWSTKGTQIYNTCLSFIFCNCSITSCVLIWICSKEPLNTCQVQF